MGWFVQDGYVRHFTAAIRVPSTQVSPLAVLQALTYFSTVFGVSLISLSKNNSILLWMMPFLTKPLGAVVRRTDVGSALAYSQVSPTAHHSECEGDSDK